MLFNSFVFGIYKIIGRNSFGRITVFHRGGGAKRAVRLLDFRRSNVDAAAFVVKILYDPCRSCKIALLCYSNGFLSFILCPFNLNCGAHVSCGDNATHLLGNCLSLGFIPLGVFVHNVELYPNSGGKFVRSAGTSALLIKRLLNNYIVLRLPSGEERCFLDRCKATIGSVSVGGGRGNRFFSNLLKAGRNRWNGFRPIVRGVAMNPVDHPHGGGEGKTSGGRCSVSPWGLLTKGKKTRSKRKKLFPIVKRRYVFEMET